MTASKSKLQPQLFSADEEIARLEQALVAAKHKRQKLGKLSVVLNTQLKQHKLAMIPEHERIMALLNGQWTSGEIIFNIFEDLCSPHLIEYLDQGTTIFISRLGVIKQSSDLNPISFTNPLRKLVEAMMMKMSTPPLPTADSHHKLYSINLGRNVSRIATCCLELFPVEVNGHFPYTGSNVIGFTGENASWHQLMVKSICLGNPNQGISLILKMISNISLFVVDLKKLLPSECPLLSWYAAIVLSLENCSVQSVARDELTQIKLEQQIKKLKEALLKQLQAELEKDHDIPTSAVKNYSMNLNLEHRDNLRNLFVNLNFSDCDVESNLFDFLESNQMTTVLLEKGAIISPEAAVIAHTRNSQIIKIMRNFLKSYSDLFNKFCPYHKFHVAVSLIRQRGRGIKLTKKITKVPQAQVTQLHAKLTSLQLEHRALIVKLGGHPDDGFEIADEVSLEESLRQRTAAEFLAGKVIDLA